MEEKTIRMEKTLGNDGGAKEGKRIEAVPVEELQKYDKIIAACAAALKKDAKDVKATEILDKVISRCEKHLESKIPSARLFFVLGNAREAKGDVYGALEEWKRAAWSNEQWLPPLRKIAVASMHNNPPYVDRAIEALEGMARLTPDDPAVHYSLARMRELNNDRVGAQRALAAYFTLKGDKRNAFFHLGLSKQYAGDPKSLGEARVCYGQAIQLDPDFEEAYRNTGMACKLLGDGEQEAAYTRKADELKAAREKAGGKKR